MSDHNGQTCGCACHNGATQPCDMLGGCGAHWNAENASDRPTATPEPSEVTKVARNLTAIEELTVELLTEAVHKANDALMPGGAAMVALANVANQQAWENLYEFAEAHGIDATHVEDEDDEWEPPLQTLCFWSEQWREELGHLLDARPTIATEAGFIRWCLNWAWENELHFEDFARDMHRARLRLEAMRKAGRGAERSRVKCINVECERSPRLVLTYGTRADQDRWKCPACKRLYDAEDYRLAKAELLSREDANRHVKYQDAREAIGRSDRTFRKWVRFWHVRSYRDRFTGQVWVWWPDVREADRDTRKRNRQAA